MPSHESEALEDKQKLQVKTFSELAECLARISPEITLYGRLFKYSDEGIKRDAYIFTETGPYQTICILRLILKYLKCIFSI